MYYGGWSGFTCRKACAENLHFRAEFRRLPQSRIRSYKGAAPFRRDGRASCPRSGILAMLLSQIEVTQVTQTGITLGSALAIVCSWQRNKSIILAIIAGFLTWIYVIWFAMTRRPDEKK